MADVRITAATVEEQDRVADLITRALAAYPEPVAVDTPRRLPNRKPGPDHRLVMSVIPLAPQPQQHTVHVEREDASPDRSGGERDGGRRVVGRVQRRRALPPGTGQ